MARERDAKPLGPTRLRIQVLEPYAAVSHRLQWEGLARHGAHELSIDSLPPRLWKFRMRTASFHFARLLGERAAGGEAPPDLIVASEYLSVAEMVPLLPPSWRAVPIVVDFHENQLTYPLQEGEERDLHFAWSHLHAALVARRVVFHSEFHRDELLAALPALIRPVPDVDLGAIPGEIAARAVVLPLGTDLPAAPPRLEPVEVPTILWSHRWEYDKAPERFLAAVQELRSAGEAFRVRLLGQRFREEPRELEDLRDLLGEDLAGDAYLHSRGAYIEAIRGAEIVVSSARHEFFGLSTLEAIRSGLYPVLPAALAYPELLPEEARAWPCLYPEGELAPALAETLARVRRGEDAERRRAIVAGTDRYAWERVAPRYDELFLACTEQGGER